MSKNNIEKLIYLFSKIPGLGPRSSRRAVLYLLKNKETMMFSLAELIKNTAESVKNCINCYNIDSSSICSICSDKNRESNIICVVESVADLWAIERGKIYKGTYHVLGGVLSAIDNIAPQDLNIDQLIERVKNQKITEIIFATNANIEGQTTAFYITEKLKDYDVKISQLAHGIPIGGELDYLDEGTLNAALKSRHLF
jgi:recombination protein RecR